MLSDLLYTVVPIFMKLGTQVLCTHIFILTVYCCWIVPLTNAQELSLAFFISFEVLKSILSGIE